MIFLKDQENVMISGHI